MAHYCFQCGTQLELRIRDNREREICPACDWVYYAQLKVGAAVLIEQDGKLLLLKRNHEPWKGTWMVPAGYVEADEDPKDAAVREVLEETGLEVEIGDLYTSIILMMIRAGTVCRLCIRQKRFRVRLNSMVSPVMLNTFVGMKSPPS